MKPKPSNLPSQTPVKLPARKSLPFETWSLTAFSVGTAALLFISVQHLAAEPGFGTLVKAALIGLTGGLVSYGVNHLAIKKGTELAATGFKTAGLVSVLSISAVGLGFFPSTYSGLVMNEVRELQLHDYVRVQTGFISERNRLATEASRLTPIIRSNERELSQLSDCEERESCVSEYHKGGRGATTKLLEEKAHRAGAIADQLKEGEAARKASLKRLNQYVEQFQAHLGDTGKPIKERRRELVKIDAKTKQEIVTLVEAFPVPLLQAYVNELESGVSLPRSAVAEKRVNQLLEKQAEGLTTVLDTLKRSKDKLPDFPMPAGVGTTFDYIVNFFPLAALAACIELVFPLTLWVYVLLGLVWDKHKHDSDRNRPQHARHSRQPRRAVQ